jgi:hypothetical protein
MFASFQGYERVLRLLLARGASLDLASDVGYTAMHFAVVGDRPRSLELLCAAPGALGVLGMRDLSGGTPLGFALYHKRAQCESALRAGGATY